MCLKPFSKSGQTAPAGGIPFGSGGDADKGPNEGVLPYPCRTRAAIREVGKVMGLSQDIISSLSSQIWGMSSSGVTSGQLRELGLNSGDHRVALTIGLIKEIIGFPRHLSQHVG